MAGSPVSSSLRPFGPQPLPPAPLSRCLSPCHLFASANWGSGVSDSWDHLLFIFALSVTGTQQVPTG